jgi:hypothetical protein
MIWDQEKGLVGTNVPSEWQFLLKYTGSTSLHEPGTAKYVANSGAYPPGNPHAHQQPQHLNQPGQVGQMPTGYQSGYPSTSQTQPSATYDYQGYPSQTSQQGQVGQLPSGYPSNSQSVGGSDPVSQYDASVPTPPTHNVSMTTNVSTSLSSAVTPSTVPSASLTAAANSSSPQMSPPPSLLPSPPPPQPSQSLSPSGPLFINVRSDDTSEEI